MAQTFKRQRINVETHSTAQVLWQARSFLNIFNGVNARTRILFWCLPITTTNFGYFSFFLFFWQPLATSDAKIKCKKKGMGKKDKRKLKKCRNIIRFLTALLVTFICVLVWGGVCTVLVCVFLSVSFSVGWNNICYCCAATVGLLFRCFIFTAVNDVFFGCDVFNILTVVNNFVCSF